MEHAVSSERFEEIRGRLATYEAEQDLTIIFACESGSRAWGFPSLDSDYDVRFLYVRDLPWYLSVSSKSDVVDEALEDELDIGGWDTRKALGLMRRGNAPLIEWLASPIVYLERPEAILPVRSLVETTLLPESMCHHYLAQCRRLLATIEQGPQGKLKSYFYVMRALLAARWIIERGVAPPMELWQLLDDVSPLFCSRTRLDELAAEKAASVEGGLVDRLSDLEQGLRTEHDRLAALIPKNGPPRDPGLFDEAFLAVLRATGRLSPSVGR
ncbi:MAG: nucleotidyltransferase domain-containing protein [Acidobacteriota bacterium]